MKRFYPKTKNALGILSILCGLLTLNNAKAVTFLYWDPTGTTTSATPSGNWEDTAWAPSATPTASLSTWTETDLAAFTAGSSGTGTFTVTLNANHTAAGLFNGGLTGISAGKITFAGTGELDMSSGVQGIFSSGAASSTTVNVVIGGAGGIQPGGSGSLFLNAANTYAGGTTLASSSSLTFFNNNNAFSTGTITVSVPANSLAPLLANAGTTTTLANPIQNTISGAGINFASSANTPLILNGTIGLAANNFVFKNNGNNTSPVTANGVISGTAGVTFSGANGGTTTLTAQNTYSGTTTVGVSGANSITLKLGAQNTIASSTQLTLAGGKVDLGGFNQNMSSTLLTLGAGVSTIDFSTGTPVLTLNNSSAGTWTGTLNLVNYDPTVDALFFGTDSSGLTLSQENKIEINGAGLGTLSLDNTGMVVPEPSSTALGILGGLGAMFMWVRSRRTA